jgi:CheY-like chemotaxis protein
MRNVLVVDDDESIRRVLGAALEQQDNVGEVKVVSSGPDALHLDKDFVPDVVVLDFWMPEMTGEEAAQELRKRYPEARIIAYSGVLEEKPYWADEYVIKGDLPDLDAL